MDPDLHPAVVTNVYVVRLELTSGQGWTSVHKTYESAELRLTERARKWGLDCTDLEHCPGIRSYGISYLAVED
jgi:hypothetical protein